jgi:acetylornithine deacetylase/succinyl-diaminopimelate desuccinylase-like protein
MSAFDVEYDGEAVNGEAAGGVDVLLVYEDFSTGLRARQAFEKVARQLKLDADFKVNLWKFDLLREPALLERAATEAAQADIVFLSAHGQDELPEAAHTWFDQWFERRDGKPCALVVLLDTLAGNTAKAHQAWEPLRAAALASGLDVFLHAAEELQTVRQSALDQTRPHPESRAALMDLDESLQRAEPQPYRHWGINE